MSSARQARATPAIAALVASNMWHRVYEYDHDNTTARYGHEAVEKLAVDPQRLYKTLVVVSPDNRVANALVAVADKLNFKRLSITLDARSVRMADAAVAQRKTGYVLGGISPVGQQAILPTVLDDSVLEHETVWVSGGRRGLSLELQVSDLLSITQATVANIRRERLTSHPRGLTSGSS